MTNKNNRDLDVTYSARDILELEIDVLSENTVISGIDYPLKSGKQTIELSGRNLDHILDYDVMSSDEHETYSRLFKEFRTRKAREEVKLEEQVQSRLIEPEEKEETLFKFVRNNNPYKKYLEETEKDLKPIKKLKVLRNLGPSATDIQANADVLRRERDENLKRDVDLKEAIIEIMKQNKDLLQALTSNNSKK